MRIACLWFNDETDVGKVAEHCLRLSPQICLREKHAVFIEYGKCRHLYSEEGFLARLDVILRRQQWRPLIGTGDSLPEALLRARSQTDSLARLPLEALPDLADPFAREPLLRQFIERMVASFRDLGVRHLEDFRRLPAGEIGSRFGAAGLLCHQRARGECALPWPAWRPPELISEKTEFPYFEFYGELEPILFALKAQLDSVFQRLFARGRKAQKLEVRIYCEVNSQNPQPYRSAIFDFLFPQGNSKGALPILQERLSRDLEREPITSPIEALECRVLESVTAPAGQKNFLHNREEILEQKAALLARLSEIHGAENIYQARLTEDRRPERSWRKVHFLESAPDKLDLARHLPLRPTHLQKPEKLRILDRQWIFFRRGRERILHWEDSGERISGGWQENISTGLRESFDRRYHILTLEEERLFVFETPQGDFYLQGRFA